MEYNFIPLFVPLDPSLYPTHANGTKGFDLMMFRNYIGYVLGYAYPILEQFVVPYVYIPHYVGN